MISNAEYFAQDQDLADAFAAGEMTRADYIAARVALADEWAVPATLAAQVVDFTAEQRTVLDQIGLLNLTGTVASVGDLPGGAANGDTYVVTSNGHAYIRLTGVWKDLGTYGGRGGIAVFPVDGEPDAGLGMAGDLALDLETGDFYGPKTSGGWGAPVLATGLEAKVVAANAARDAALAAKAGAESAAEVVVDIKDAFKKQRMSVAGALMDDYGMAVLVVNDDGTLELNPILVANVAKLIVSGAMKVSGSGFSWNDSYGLSAMSIDDAGVSVGTLHAVNAAITNLTMAALSAGKLSITAGLKGSGVGYSFNDSYGLSGMLIDDTGVTVGALKAASAVIGSLTLSALSLSRLTITGGQKLAGSSWAISDDYGMSIVYVDAAGIDAPNIRAMQAQLDAGAQVFLGNWPAERLIFDIVGQSLSNGHNASPSLSLTQLYGSTMLSGGIRTFMSYPYTAQTLVPLVEADVTPDESGGGVGGETPSSAATAMINRLITDENKITYTAHSFELTAMASGHGGYSLAQLAKGQTAYAYRMLAIDRIIALSADSKTIGYPAFAMVQGETDIADGTAEATYLAAYKQHRTDVDGDVRAKIAGLPAVHMIGAQVSSHCKYSVARPAIALAQYQASLDDAMIHIACPLYMLDYVADGVHLTNVSSAWMGAYIGQVWKRVVIDKATWKPLAPKSKVIQGKIMLVTFDVPALPLVLDTTWVTDPGNYGFGLVDGSGTPITVASVSLAGPDQVKIVAATTLPSDAKVQYAFGPVTGQNAGRTSGARGCLRDSAGLKLAFDPTGYNRPMHNWALISEF